MSAAWRALQARVRAIHWTTEPGPGITFDFRTGEVVVNDLSGVEREEAEPVLHNLADLQCMPRRQLDALIRREMRLLARVLPEASRDPLDDGYTPPWAEVLR